MKHAFIVLAIFLLLVICTDAYPQSNQVEPQHAILLADNALVPVRPLAVILDAQVMSTGSAPQQCTLSRGEIAITLTPYETQAMKGSTTITLPVPPIIRNQRLYVPARAIASIFGAAISLHPGTDQDTAPTVSATYQQRTTSFRAVEEGRMVQADLLGTGKGATETAFAVANLPGIDLYNSPSPTDIVDSSIWVVRGTKEVWRASLARGVSISKFVATDLTGDGTSELMLYYFTRHNYMGPFPGSVYDTRIFRWKGSTFQGVLSLTYSRDHGRLYIAQAPKKPAYFIRVDSNWQRNEDSRHSVTELYTWNGSIYRLSQRKITSKAIITLVQAKRLLGLQ